MTDEQGNLREMVIWRIEPNPRQPEGVRYRLALIRAGERIPAVLYDNHHPKGHHRHGRHRRTREFVDLDPLIAELMTDVTRAMGARE